MLSRILTGIAVFLMVSVLIITALPLTNEQVSAAESDLGERSEATNDSGYAARREFGTGKHHMMRNAEDLDDDGYPDLPDRVMPGWNRGCMGDPEAVGEGFGTGKRRMMRNAEDLDLDLPEGFIRPCDTDGDGMADLPDGVTPRWNKGRVGDLEDTVERPFRRRGCQGAATTETP